MGNAGSSKQGSERDDLVGRSLGGKLRVERRIGAGALGVVYRAKHVLLPRPVAVKVLHARFQAEPGFRARFHAEARAASMLDHPSLVRVVDFGEEPEGMLWLAMELLEGTPLDQVLALERSLPLDRGAEIVLGICAGLAHAHARGVVHGDVRPSNVVLVRRESDDGEEIERPKLCDFGVARTPGGAAEVLESGVHASLSAPAYVPPEQWFGEPLDARSDIFSCAVLLCELVTGEPPFIGDQNEIVLRAPVRLADGVSTRARRDVDARFHAFVLKALARERHDRFATMREMRAALRDLVARAAAAGALSSPVPLARLFPSSVPPPRPRLDSEMRVRDAEASLIDPSREADAALERDGLAELVASAPVDILAERVARLEARAASSQGRDVAAAAALALLSEAPRLLPVARRLLDEDVAATPYVVALVARAGDALARSLWTARVAEPANKVRRERFVTWLLAVGPGAQATIRAGLGALSGDVETGHYAELVEDLLLALPARCDDDLAAEIGAFASSPVPRVRSLAVAALARQLGSID